ESGLIDGYADGTFRPQNTLTGFAFLKMLLTALGYDSTIEGYTGANWTVNVMGRAQQEGLTTGDDEFVGSRALTREEACLFAVNTLRATLVEYDSKGTNVTVNGATVAIGASKPTYVTSSISGAATAIDDTKDNTTHDYTVEFGERYQPDLKLVSDADDFDRPARTWNWKGRDIGTYVDTEKMVAEYTTAVTGEELYDLLTKSIIDDYTVEYYVDGKLTTDVIKNSNMIRTNRYNYDTTGNGALTQVFVDNDDELVTITTINTWIAKADADYNEKRDELSLTIYTDLTGVNSTVKADDIPAAADVAEDEYVLVNVAESTKNHYDVIVISEPEVISETKLSKYSKMNYVVADGTQYDYAMQGDYDENVNCLTAGELKEYNKEALDNTYNIYLDQYGYVIGTKKVDGDLKYLFLTGYDRPTTHLGIKTAEAAAIFLDGSMDPIEIDVKETNANISDEKVAEGYAKLSDTDHDKMSHYNMWFTYSVDKDGIYELTPVDNWVNVKKDEARNVINPSSVVLRGTDGSEDTSSRAWGNDDSIYITAETSTNDYNKTIIDDVDSVYTGVQNVDIELAGVTGLVNVVFACYDDDGYIIGAVVLGKDVNNTKNFAYALDTYEAMSEYVKDDDGYYYWDFEAVVDGEIVTLTVKDEYKSVINDLRDAIVTGDGENNDKTQVGAMLELTYDADGYVVDALVLEDGMDYPEEDDDPEDFIYGNNEYTDEDCYAEDYSVYLVNVADDALKTNTAGNTLWIDVTGATDNGLTIASGAPIVVIQEIEDEDGDRMDVEVEVYSNFNAAFRALPDFDKDSKENYFNGQIAAVLNDRGTAEYVVMNSGVSDVADTDDGNDSVRKGNIELTSVSYNDSEKRYEVNFKTTKAINGADTFVVEITTENGAKVASTETPFSVKDWTEGKTGRLDVPSATKKSAEELNIVVTFYDEDGNVLAYAEDFLAV
ncbi:S-layer homology domain-containing protein, partial [Oscillibacter valericigenes]|uniref:S-layer homology domain-containing protein n=1 Tax=Oscillibacter valericigenes TaxID=351091 RepID=UPI00195A94FB